MKTEPLLLWLIGFGPGRRISIYKRGWGKRGGLRKKTEEQRPKGGNPSERKKGHTQRKLSWKSVTLDLSSIIHYNHAPPGQGERTAAVFMAEVVKHGRNLAERRSSIYVGIT